MTRLMDRMRRLEEARNALLRRLDGVDADILRWRPGPDRWSVQDVVEHLVVSDGLAAQRIRQVRENDADRPPAATLLDRFRRAMVMFILRNRWIRVKTPAAAFNPTGLHTLDELVARWKEHHRVLRAFAEEADPAEADRPLVRHPVGGPMTADQTFHMLEVHLRRHALQVDAILSAYPG